MPTTARFKSKGCNWIAGTVDGLDVQAKVFTEPSHYGIEQDPRISKLWVATPARMPSMKRTVLFNYDRGHDVDELDPSTLQQIISAVSKAIR